jgi:sigma-B regulation protein RsbU (phosphoserine phosphatase)
VTLFFGILDVRNMIMNYVNAGHNYPVLLQHDNNKRYLFEGGLPLGVDDKPEYISGKVQINKSDMLYMYTDGITDAFNSENKQYGEERLLNVLTADHEPSSRNLVDNILKDISAFRGDADVFDDMSMIVMKRVG